MALDRRFLWDRLAAKERDPAVLWLMHLILFGDPTANCRLRGARQADFDSLPPRRRGAPRLAGIGVFQELADPCSQERNFVDHDIPDQVVVDAEVAVDESVSHPGHGTPVDVAELFR